MYIVGQFRVCLFSNFGWVQYVCIKPSCQNGIMMHHSKYYENRKPTEISSDRSHFTNLLQEKKKKKNNKNRKANTVARFARFLQLMSCYFKTEIMYVWVWLKELGLSWKVWGPAGCSNHRETEFFQVGD